MRRAFILCVVICSLSLSAAAQSALEPATLAPGQPVEREIAGGESHAYQISLAAGQFLRVVVEQKGVNVALVLTAPDGKKVAEVNLTRYGELESLSAEAAAGGEHQLTITAIGAGTPVGPYQVRLEVKASATARDRQRIAAERWLLEGDEMLNQGGKTAEQAIDKLQQALSVWRELGDPYWTAWSLSSIGVAYYSLSRYEKAIEHYDQALAISREIKDRAGEGILLNGLGVFYRAQSRIEKSLEYFEQALATFREVKNRSGEGAVLLNLGAAYNSLSRNEKAIEYYDQALTIFREMKNRANEGMVYQNLGISHVGLTRYEKAIQYYEQALAISREVKDRFGEGSTLNTLGLAYSSLSRYEKAVEFYEQALAISREVKDRSGEGYALNNLGLAYSKMSRYEKAIEFCEQALSISREVKNRVGEAAALYNLAQTERAQGNLPAARTHVEENLKLEEATRAGIVTPESRASFLAAVQRSYGLYTDILMSQHRVEPTEGFDALALEVSERRRARSLLDLLAEAKTDLRQGIAPALIEREVALAKQLNDKARQLTQSARPEQTAALKQEISRLENDYERAQAAIRKASPRYAALTQPQPLKLTEIQAQLDADTLLLEYSLGEERSYLWAVTRDSLSSYELPKGELVEKEARQLYELLTARSAIKRGESAQQRQERIGQAELKLPAVAQSLSRTLLAPVAAHLGNKRLVIVADGALQYIPFAMLPHPSAGRDEPLVVNHEVMSLPSASALAIQRAELAGRKPAPKLLAVIADPVFDRADERLKTAAPEAGDSAQTQAVALDDARSIEHLAGKPDDKAGAAARTLVIPRLPFTRQEATRLLALAPKASSFGATDFQASRATVLGGGLGQYRYVHFATHGVMDSERPGLSALVLSTVDEQGRPRDGFLRANDIYNLRLPAELVVLSACQTGLGKEVKGEGLVSLTRGFMYAGAARVVVSLWSVNDRATADLMATFYERMLKRGERPAAALRAAQVEMWKQKRWQSPYYWAAFTMQGEWR